MQKTSFGYPARKASGFDGSRLEMLLAVLAKRGGVDLGQYDVYLNVAGGMRVKEPAADLAVLLALASAYRDVPLPAMTAAWGEAGLGGELRPVVAGDRRILEAASLGITRIIAPPSKGSSKKRPANAQIVEATTVLAALAAAGLVSGSRGRSLGVPDTNQTVNKVAVSNVVTGTPAGSQSRTSDTALF